MYFDANSASLRGAALSRMGSHAQVTHVSLSSILTVQRKARACDWTVGKLGLELLERERERGRRRERGGRERWKKRGGRKMEQRWPEEVTSSKGSHTWGTE